MWSPILVLSTLCAGAWAHGRVLEPPSRASAWRFDFPTPADYDDDGANCGGFAVQHASNGGKCGICGDAYNIPPPRPHELGGLYGQGVVVARYLPGSLISTTVELTTSHRGFWEFKLCPDPESTEQGCFDRHILQLEDGSTKYYPNRGSTKYEVTYRLPSGLVCDHCVLQWRYTAGNNWGVCENGTQGLGCGAQEQFGACSDISISKSKQLRDMSENNEIPYPLFYYLKNGYFDAQQGILHLLREKVPPNKHHTQNGHTNQITKTSQAQLQANQPQQSNQQKLPSAQNQLQLSKKQLQSNQPHSQTPKQQVQLIQSHPKQLQQVQSPKQQYKNLQSSQLQIQSPKQQHQSNQPHLQSNQPHLQSNQPHLQSNQPHLQSNQHQSQTTKQQHKSNPHHIQQSKQQHQSNQLQSHLLQSSQPQYQSPKQQLQKHQSNKQQLKLSQSQSQSISQQNKKLNRQKAQNQNQQNIPQSQRQVYPNNQNQPGNIHRKRKKKKPRKSARYKKLNKRKKGNAKLKKLKKLPYEDFPRLIRVGTW